MELRDANTTCPRTMRCGMEEFKQTPDLLTDLYDPVYKMYKTIKVYGKTVNNKSMNS